MGISKHQFDIEKYEKESDGLTLIQHGIYLLLRNATYKAGGAISADPGDLYRVCVAVLPDEQRAVDLVVNRFFRRVGAVLLHDDCTAEICRVERQSTNQRAKAQKRWGDAAAFEKRCRGIEKTMPPSMPRHAKSDAAASSGAPKDKSKSEKLYPPYSPPQLSGKSGELELTSGESPPAELPRANYSERFKAFWDAYPTRSKGSKWSAWKVWKRDRLDGRYRELIDDVQLRGGSHRPWLEGFVPHVSSYLNQRRWEEDIDRRPARARGGAAQRQDIESSNQQTAAEWVDGGIE